MPPKKKPAGPTPVDAITHGEKRANIPTADTQDFVPPEMEQPIPLRYPRDPSLDPQLVWKGKDELDGEDLVAEAPPIYIQEKIDPRVLVENLRQTAARPEDEPELSLFDDFDGLNELDQLEHYQHAANWSNRMILGDSLNVMASLAEREALRGKVQMIYIDPPYGIKFGSNWQVSTRKRDVKDGKLADAPREVEQIKAFRDTWRGGIHSYLTYLRDRLVAVRDLLTESGSCFFQIGDQNAHVVRSLLDEVFGPQNFVSQIVVQKTEGQTTDGLSPVVDYVLWYARDAENVKYRQLYAEKRAGGPGATGYTLLEHRLTGEIRSATRDEIADSTLIPHNWDLFDGTPLVSESGGQTTTYPVEFAGRTYTPGQNYWKTNESGMNRLIQARRIVALGRRIEYKRYLSDFPVYPLNNLWQGLGERGFVGQRIYVVQTAAKLIERCILMSTDPGDLVLDPTCGSGTTAYAAEQWGRRWITIDTSRVALAIARQRLMGARYPFYLLSDSPEGLKSEFANASVDAPRSPTRGDIRHGFVYERVPHIMLKSIANNPDIVEGMTRDEIDAAIKRHSDFELLYDKPYEDKKKVRVAGPFTVESLSPHRSLAFAGSAVDASGALNTDAAEADGDTDDGAFEKTIIDNLRSAGIQNGRKGERLEFDSVEPYAGVYIQALGEREDAEPGTPSRVGITVGPKYGTVGPSFIREAAREAIKAGDMDLLCVLAFAFDPTVLGTDKEFVAAEDGFANVAAERKLGKVPVLLVRMNADLVMGEELKKTGAGNLFTVFGEPDIKIAEEGDELVVTLNGVDVYDPNTGQVRSNDTSQIALWMIDTAYNEDSFFVRHCYFTGGNDPFKKLKSALKADIDEDAWATLYRTESRPFARPETGKIAVKVINDYGDEVMKVFEV